MTTVQRWLTAWTVLLFLCGNCPLQAAESADLEFFEKRIRPLLATHCYECHSVKATKLKANLRLDSRKALLKGGDSGPAIATEKWDKSLLLEAVRYETYEMPPKGKLPAEDIAAFEKWVKLGAPWPEEPEPVADSAPPPFDLEARKKSHWCWQPIQSPPLPQVNDTAWSRDDLDRFILAKLEERGFKPAPTVDRRTLVRRLSFDLIGLPPTSGEVEAFVGDAAPNAVEKVVDRLLESPHFGERWGRHWLDLVRYAESRGHEFDNDAPNAWQYRDYVIRALNADVPYDQFVKEHIAGDLLDPPRLNPEKKFNESILGTGFWHLGEWVHSPVDIRKDETDRFDNMLDVMSKTFLGVTVACARCHDHKFDAISQKDYYALSGFLQGSDYRQVAFEALEHNKWLAGELAEIDARATRSIRELVAKAIETHLEQIRGATLRALAESNENPGAILVTAHVPLFDLRRGYVSEVTQDGHAYATRPKWGGDLLLTFDSNGKPNVEVVRCGFAYNDPAWKDATWELSPSPNQKGQLEQISRSGRTLRSPTFDVVTGEVYCRVRGAGHVVACVDSHRLIAGPLHGQTIVKIDSGSRLDWKWVRLNLDRYRGHRAHLEFTPAAGATLDVQMAVDQNPAEVFSGARARSYFTDRVLKQWVAGQCLESNEAAMIAAAIALVRESPAHRDAVQSILDEWANERRDAPAGVSKGGGLAPAMLDGDGEDDRLLIRGNSSTPGGSVPRRFLEAVDGGVPMSIPHGSGRLQLATRVVDPANPLTRRVLVNRLWHHLMGRGIVPTVDDFGVLGQRPTHPELLDYLAAEFQKDGQSIKRMIRRMVLSQTYRMSGDSDPKTVEADPKNELWHHRPPKRLEGEVIRDALLAVSGRLDRTQFGPSVKVHLTSFMEGRGRPPQSGPLDGAGRRSIYLEVRRNFLSPFMLTFDTPNPFSTMGRRNVSNVPAQALILMNDPFVRECAELWAKRAVAEGPAGSGERIGWLYRAGFGRPPTEQETGLLLGFLPSGESAQDVAGWTDMAHAIINTKEFIFVR